MRDSPLVLELSTTLEGAPSFPRSVREGGDFDFDFDPYFDFVLDFDFNLAPMEIAYEGGMLVWDDLLV